MIEPGVALAAMLLLLPGCMDRMHPSPPPPPAPPPPSPVVVPTPMEPDPGPAAPMTPGKTLDLGQFDTIETLRAARSQALASGRMASDWTVIAKVAGEKVTILSNGVALTKARSGNSGPPPPPPSRPPQQQQ